MLSTNYLRIYLLTLISFLVGTSQFIIAGVLDKIATSLDISISSAGQLVTVFALASGLGTPILTVLVSKYSLKKQLLIALFIFLVGAFLTPLNLGYDVLIFARIITGIGTILFVVVAYVVAGRLAGEGKQGSGMSYIALGFSLSQVAGVPLGRIIANIYNWQMIFYIVGVLVLLGSIVVMLSFQNRTPQKMPSLKEQMYILKDKRVALSLSITVFAFITFSAITTFITPLIFSIEKVSEHTLALIFTILGIASVIGSKSGATIADKIGVTRVLSATLIITAISLIAMNVFSSSLSVFITMLTIWNITIWMFGPTQGLNLSKMVPTHASILLSLNSSFVQVGFALGAFLGGITIESFSIHSILLLGVMSTLIALAIYLYTLKKHT
ncbi:MFS transporter [Sulfurospirillum arsenophilum]|uniref:MFS transporter n=1 Tax=Sulfurospirillum arsenophilum TaxID=56698 RepID=UPI0005A9823C|nr:MFS transporter [Sulfurospirillum arsenophilum]